MYGVGLFFTGKSGMASRSVLDLVERGHRLVADDLVFVSSRERCAHRTRTRTAAPLHGNPRVGLLDIPAIFGIHAVRQEKRLEVMVIPRSGRQRPGRSHRTGRADHRDPGVEIPKITVHLNPGKNITVIAEVIAMNHLLRYYRGYDTATAFNEQLIDRMRRKSDVQRYLQEDDE